VPHCPNPNCPHRRRSGRPAEYRPGAERCSDCGATLAPGPVPPPAPRPAAPVWPAALKRRLLWTSALALAAAAAAWLPNPLLDTAVLEHLAAVGVLAHDRLGPFNLGLGPFVIAFVLVELFALAVPALRRRRLSDRRLRARLWVAALVLGAAWAFARGLGQAWWLEQFHYGQYYDTLGRDPVLLQGWDFRLAHALLVAAGSGLLALAARAISRHGAGRGFAVLLLAGGLAELPRLGAALWRSWDSGLIVPARLLLPLLSLAGLVVGLVFAFRLGDRWAGRAPVRLPSCGSSPLEIGLLLCLLPLLLADWTASPWLESLAGRLTPGSGAALAVQLVAVVVLALPFSSLFYWRRRRMLRRAPYRAWWWQVRVASAAVLAGLALFDYGLARLVPAAPAIGLPATLELLVWVALAMDFGAELRARRHAAGGTDLVELETHQDLADGLAAHKAYAAAQPQHAFHLSSVRFRSLSYFFGPYVPLVLLGPPAAERRAFTGGETLDEAELLREFE